MLISVKSMVVIEVKNTKWLEVVYMVFVLTVIIVKVRENEKKIVMKKSSNDVNHGNVNINIVTARPREKLFNQNEIGYQNVDATPGRYQKVSVTSDN